MTLREEIKPYIDGYGLVSPAVVPKGAMRSCDNGTSFLSEYHILLKRRGEDRITSGGDAWDWSHTIRRCMQEPGLTVRAPGDRASDSPDNTLAILSAAQVLGVPSIAIEMLRYGRKHRGWFNPEKPGSIFHKNSYSIYWETFLWRQLQLLTATVAVAGKLRRHHLPLVMYTASIILITGLRNIPLSDTDARRGCWHLIQAMKRHSWLCKKASEVWYKKLYKDFPTGMRGVAALYYEKGHPFQKYDWE